MFVFDVQRHIQLGECNCTLSAPQLPASVANLTELTRLELPPRNLIRGSIPPSLFGLRKLKTIMIQQGALSGTIPPVPDPQNSKLEHLNFGRNALTGSIPDSIWELPQLSYVFVISI
jgi:hypothetical protein